MANFVKEGYNVIVLLSPDEDKNSAKNLISELEKILGPTGKVLIVDLVNFKSSEYHLFILIR